jgi:glucan phosphoethanolaminetransferase (alkaline phosphatase superfamily)
MQNLLRKCYEKILLLTSIIFRGDYRTNTWASVPAMLTKVSSSPDLSASIINLANDAGYDTYWFSNHTQVSTWDFSVSSLALQSKHSYFSALEDTESVSLDEVLVEKLETVLQNDDAQSKKLIVLHMYGSHMTFQDRYPESFDQFESDNELLDEYDNTVLYTDHLLSEVATLSKQFDANFIFMADHGLGRADGDLPLKHDVRPDSALDSIHVPFISNMKIELDTEKLVNLFYFECIFSMWSGIKATELSDEYCIAALKEEEVIYFDSNLSLRKRDFIPLASDA